MAAKRRKKGEAVVKTGGPMPDRDVDEIVCEALDYLGSNGQWGHFTEAMGRAGWSVDDCEQAVTAFGERCGRSL